MALARLISYNKKLKKPKKSEKNIFTIYLPKKACIERADTLTIDTELVIKLPENTQAYLATKFEGYKIHKIVGPNKERLWITLLNESYFDKHKINKGDVIGYLVVEPEDSKIQYETKKRNRPIRRKNIEIIIYPKAGRSVGRSTGRRKKQMFVNK